MDFDSPDGIIPMFFHAVMKDGTIDVADCEVLR